MKGVLSLHWIKQSYFSSSSCSSSAYFGMIQMGDVRICSWDADGVCNRLRLCRPSKDPPLQFWDCRSGMISFAIPINHCTLHHKKNWYLPAMSCNFFCGFLCTVSTLFVERNRLLTFRRCIDAGAEPAILSFLSHFLGSPDSWGQFLNITISSQEGDYSLWKGTLWLYWVCTTYMMDYCH